MSLDKNQVHFDVSTQKPFIFPPLRKNHDNSDPYAEVESIFILTIESSQFWCRDAKTNLISIPTLNLSPFRTLHWNHVKLDPPHKQIQFRSKHWHQVIFGPHKNKKIPSPHKKTVNFDLKTKTKSFSTPTPKPSQFRSPPWNQVKFDPHQWNQVNFDHPHKNEVKSDDHTKTR